MFNRVAINIRVSTQRARVDFALRRVLGLLSVLALLIGVAPSAAWACACGCSVFDVGGGLLPQEGDHGGRVWIEWWHADQNRLLAGATRISPDNNADKRITTNWYALGFQHTFNRDWSVMARLPYANRSFVQDDGTGSGTNNTFNAKVLGDLEIMGMYTGFSKDMSTGIIFGLKLPTGNFTVPSFDRDTQVGTGSTDLIIGGFHRGMITGDNAWQYFAQVRALIPFAYTSALDPTGSGLVQTYKPGYQVDGAAGILYNNWYNVLGLDKITPILQVIGSHRAPDGGDAADPFNSGFDRLMIAPAIEFTKVIDEVNKRVMKLYVDVEIPIYYRVNAAVNDDGNVGQLVAPYLTKVILSYNY